MFFRHVIQYGQKSPQCHRKCPDSPRTAGWGTELWSHQRPIWQAPFPWLPNFPSEAGTKKVAGQIPSDPESVVPIWHYISECKHLYWTLFSTVCFHSRCYQKNSRAGTWLLHGKIRHWISFSHCAHIPRMSQIPLFPVFRKILLWYLLSHGSIM